MNIKKSTYYILFLSALPFSYAEEVDINEKWRLKEIVDESIIFDEIPPDNFIEINDDYIIQNLGNYGKRAYKYKKVNKTLYLLSGDEIIEWKIISIKDNKMHIETPIGKFILQRP